MTHGLNRRPAVPSDAKTIVSWFFTRAEVLSWAGPTVPDPLTARWPAQQFETASYYVWVDACGRLQGVFALNFRGDGNTRFGRFALSPGFRGRKLARTLVQEVISVARSMGARQLSLGVYGSNRIAKHVYESVGFEVFEERPAQEDPSGVDYQMRLDL